MNKALERRIINLQIKAKKEPVTVDTLINLIHGKGSAVVLIILSLPLCLPIHIPIITSIFGIIFAIFGIDIAIGRALWLPKRFLKQPVNYTTVKKSTDMMLWMYKKIYFLIRPRIPILTQPPIARVINGLVVFFMGIFIINPIPIPFSHFFPALSILLMGIGLLEDDGIFVIGSYVFFIVTFLFYVWIFLSMIKR